MPNVPRYSKFAPASETASKIKRRTRSKDTKAELLLRRALWRRGLRYRTHVRDLPGKPDIVFRRVRVVVFCDGDFWHGRSLTKRLKRLESGTNARYWTAKIEANALRDRRVTRALRALGWTVIRVWETDVIRDVERVATAVERQLNASRSTLGRP